MPIFLLEHFEDCAPLKPCVSCQAAAFLRSKLSSEDMAALLRMAKPSAAVSSTHSRKVSPTDSIKSLALGRRVLRVLENGEITTVGDVTEKTPRELSRLPNFGYDSLLQIVGALAKVGLTLKAPD